MSPIQERSTFTPIGIYTQGGTGPVTKVEETYRLWRQRPLSNDPNRHYPKELGKRDIGGHFLLQSVEVHRPPTSVGKIRGNSGLYTNYFYEGGLCTYFPYSERLITDPSAWGPKAYARMKPTKPVFSALNSLYELRELPEMLRQRFLDMGLKSIPNYWIALQFGWGPLLRDIIAMCDLQRKAQKQLAQLLRDNGKPVRRRVNLAAAEDTMVFENIANNAMSPSFVDRFYRARPYHRTTRRTVKLTWASAQFRYHLPDGPRDIAWRAKMLRALYGLNPSPSVVYKMIPWSWLVDWFSNLGAMISNLEAGVADRLAADYFYLMEELQLREEILSKAVFAGMDFQSITCQSTSSSVSTCKRRMKGDPFGWATPEATLSGMQLSILGALGLSRIR